MNENRLQVTKIGCISLVNATHLEAEFGHDDLNGVLVHENADVYSL